MKIKAIPFLIGSIGYSLFTDRWEFTICAAVVFSILVLNKQVDLI